MQPNPATNIINPYPKITADRASDITSQFKPQPKSVALQEPGQTPAQYIDTLEENNQSEDAIKTLAHGMPERESVWYACQSSDRVADKMAPADKQALTAAKDWVENPSPATKQQAADAAAKTDFQGPGAWAAQAAAWSQSTPGTASGLPPSGALPVAGGVGAPGGGVPSAPGVKAGSLTPHAASGSVLLAAAMENNKIGPKAPAMAPPSAPTLQSPTAPKFQAPTVPKPTIPQLAAPKAPAAPEMPPAQQAEVAKMHKPYIDLGKAIASGKNTWIASA